MNRVCYIFLFGKIVFFSFFYINNLKNIFVAFEVSESVTKKNINKNITFPSKENVKSKKKKNDASISGRKFLRNANNNTNIFFYSR